ncbi:aldose 1-epimerase [Neorhizobium galegae]|uniref:aldose 1-epimerase n=1 Tax=Neorhizobium galegae TaxID=399 RepID=UPI001AEB0373|nr:aldose 1-epimerase [Neorhizobium galegae]
MVDRIELRNGDCRATIAPEGGAILSATVSGTPLMVATQTPGLATRLYGSEACFPLVPFGGRIEHNGFSIDGADYRLARNTQDPLVLHGEGWLRPWSVAEVGRDTVRLCLDVAADDRSPYAYRAEQRITLLPHGLMLMLSVVHKGARRLPYGLGFHPYLPVGPGSTVEFQAGGVWTEREMHLPGILCAPAGEIDFGTPRAVPEGWINNCYEGWTGRAVIGEVSGAALILEASPPLRYLMLYKPAGPSGFLCVEPMSHRPNAHGDPHAGGLAVLAPGDSLSASMRLERRG